VRPPWGSYGIENLLCCEPNSSSRKNAPGEGSRSFREIAHLRHLLNICNEQNLAIFGGEVQDARSRKRKVKECCWEFFIFKFSIRQGNRKK